MGRCWHDRGINACWMCEACCGPLEEPAALKSWAAIFAGVPGLPLSQAEFNALVSDHGPAMYRMAYRIVGNRHEAEDLVQEAYRSAWKSRASYQAGLGE